MIHGSQYNKAKEFAALHHDTKLFVLPNAWDALSAKIFEQSGANAIGTTSAGVAISLGYQDGQQMSKAQLIAVAERIVKSTDLPVSVDIEAGYGNTIDEVCNTVKSVIDIGAVGINLEDGCPDEPNKLIQMDVQAKRIRAIRDMAQQSA